MKIVIKSPSYNPGSGGIIVLHKLCDILLELGYDAGFYVEKGESFYVNSTYKFNKFNQEDIDPVYDIVVYPEIVWDNPLKFNRVVRYIMNVGHVTLGRKDTWSDSDFWIYYSEKFYDGIKPKNILSVSDSKLEYFRDYKVPRPYKDCFSYRKKLDDPGFVDVIHSPDAIEINFKTSDEDLIKIFNSCERFYCYDTASHLNVLASLCGCDSIVVPDGKTREEVIDKSPKLQYGVAYGVEEIEQARQTRTLLRSFLEQEQIKQVEQVDLMFKQITAQI